MSSTRNLNYTSPEKPDEGNGYYLLYDVLDEALDSDEGSEHDLIDMLASMGEEDRAGEGVLVVEEPFAVYEEISANEFYQGSGRTSSLLKSDEYNLDRFILRECRTKIGNPEISHILTSLDDIVGDRFESFNGSARKSYKSRMEWQDFEELHEWMEGEGYDQRY
jgi:hypothetical protein